ncbi:hypothetical protein C5167_032473 [Papaver somniferum]|uniref:Uncharacterized protein n=1 Tax=Papaver somniferum TaxID=3469 RepID=A0A4Y7KAW6_PAPSO|nr:hypothetical protein C5167_032473 [Papaver somniferum]
MAQNNIPISEVYWALVDKADRKFSMIRDLPFYGGTREMVNHLVNQLKLLVEECKRTFQESDFKEWRQVLHEIARFLKYDTPFLNIRPLRYSMILDPNPDSLPHVTSWEGRRNLRLREAIVSSYHHNEVKFTELTLDTFRMLQCLEWEPSGSFYQAGASTGGNGISSGQNGQGSNRPNYSQDITDPLLPPNPRKAILYHPAVTHFIAVSLAVLATIIEDLPPDGILLIYLSASGKRGQGVSSPLSAGAIENASESTVKNFQSHDMASDIQCSSTSTSQHNIPTHSYSQCNDNNKHNHPGCLWMGSRGTGGIVSSQG